MANLQIKGMSDEFYAQIKALAIKTPAQILLELSGAWEDGKTADEIIRDLKRSRKNVTEKRRAF